MSRLLPRRRSGPRGAHSDLVPRTRVSISPRFDRVLSFQRNSEDAVLGSDARDLAYSALMDLPRDQRRVLLLAAVYKRTALEISEQEGIPLERAKTQIRTGLSRVRTAVKRAWDAQDRLQTPPQK
jgi:DNA-directed RNA polymerase specialized sigma24 family protein